MRLNELFITEKINLTFLRNAITDAIYKDIEYCVRQIHYKCKPYLKSKLFVDAAEKVQLSLLKPELTSWLILQLNIIISESLTEISSKEAGLRSEVDFRDTGGAGGHAAGVDIRISKKLTEKMASALIDAVFDATYIEVPDESQLIQTMMDQLLRADYNLFYESVNKIVSEITSVFIHELTHVIQYKKENSAKMQAQGYRSYIEPDKKKFYKSVGRINAGTADDADFNAYLGSPQEIAAFAQQEALSYIESNDVHEITDLEELLDFKDKLHSYGLGSRLRYTSFNRFKNPENKTEYIIFKRFSKLVYQEVVNYVDQRIKLLKDKQK